LITRDEYFKSWGFKVDPFASTNAEHEEYLNEYFVHPPYFGSLVGSFDKPKTSMVIAPRGFGKTAQRRRFEKLAVEYCDEIVCIVYDNFPIEGISDLKHINIDKHLQKIIKSLLIAFLSKMYETPEVGYNDYERKMLLSLIERYLNNITPTDVKNTIDNIKGAKGKLYDFWINASKPISSIINMILKAKNLGSVDLELKQQKVSEISSVDYFLFLQSLFARVGFKAVYILIDKIDENHLTGNDSLASYSLIRPLIKDLSLLEGKLVVFKFFLWDKITDHWAEDIRLDRIEHFELEWEKRQIKDMINKRLSVLSDEKINMLQQVLDCETSTIDDIFLFAQNSPRNLINLLNFIFDEHINRAENVNSKPDIIDITRGIDKYCADKFTDVITDKTQQANLRRLKMATFTIPFLGNNLFKVKENVIRNMIQPWTRAGFVITLPNKVSSKTNKRPVNLYSVNDIVIARHICSNQRLEDFISRNIFICDDCGQVVIFDRLNSYGRDDFNCPHCQNSVIIS